jgi:hypothetical protein
MSILAISGVWMIKMASRCRSPGSDVDQTFEAEKRVTRPDVRPSLQDSTTGYPDRQRQRLLSSKVLETMDRWRCRASILDPVVQTSSHRRGQSWLLSRRENSLDNITTACKFAKSTHDFMNADAGHMQHLSTSE